MNCGKNLFRLDGNTHVSAVAAFSAVTLVFADTLVSREPSVATAATRPLSVTSLLALATTLAAGFCRQIRMFLFARSEWEVGNGCRGLLP